MPVSRHDTVLSRYRYDPLDRQTDCTLLALPTIQRFYCTSRLATEIQGALRTSVFQHDDQLLAQQRQQDGSVETTLLATDQQRSVLGTRGLSGSHFLAYSPYGHRPAENGLLSLLGFNGERPDPLTGHYHLGNGYRQFNPVLMRFNSPDSWSPFGDGGLNAYTYCGGDPRNGADPSGHFKVQSLLKVMRKTAKTHHSGPTLISQTTEDAIKDTVKTLGGKNNITKSAKEAGMKPKRYLLEKVVEGRVTKTEKILSKNEPSAPRSKEEIENIIKQLEDTDDIYQNILVGTRSGKLRPEDLKLTRYKNHVNLSAMMEDLQRIRNSVLEHHASPISGT